VGCNTMPTLFLIFFRLHTITMSKKRGVGELNKSISVKGKYEDYEDPDRTWIDLVLAVQSGSGARVQEILAVAKRSKWTHESWDLAITEDEDWTPESGFGSDTEDYSEEEDGEPAAGSVEEDEPVEDMVDFE